MVTNRSNSQELAAALKEALNPSAGVTPNSSHKAAETTTTEESSEGKVEVGSLGLPVRKLKTTNKRSTSFKVPPMTRGAFIADTDSLLGGTETSVGVSAAEDSTLLMIDRKDLIIFFSNNPGVLLATVHSHFVQ